MATRKTTSTTANTNRKTAKKPGARSSKGLQFEGMVAAPRKTAGKPQQEGLTVQREIAILVFIALGILLFLSDLDICGTVGGALASFQFGLFGSLGYAFPFVFIFISVYLLVCSRKKGWRAYLKMFCLFLCFAAACGVAELICSKGAYNDITFTDYYEYGVKELSGGLVGGLIFEGLVPALGTIGSYVLLIAVIVICFVLATGKSILKPIGKGGSAAVRDAKSRMEARRERKDMERLARQEERQRQHEEYLNARTAAEGRLANKVSGFEINEAGIQLDNAPANPQGTASATGKTAGYAPASDILAATGLAADMSEGSRAEVSYSQDPVLTIHRTESDAAMLDENGEQKKASETAADIPGVSGDTASGSQGGTQCPIIAPIDTRTLDEIAANDNKPEEDGIPEEIMHNVDDVDPEEALRMIKRANLFVDDKDSGTGISQSTRTVGIAPAGAAMSDDTGDIAPAENVIGKEPGQDSIWGGHKNDPSGSSGAVFSTVRARAAASARPAARPRPKRNYKFPSTSLLAKPMGKTVIGNAELKETAAKLENTLRTFNIGVTVTDISCGPSVTRYELHPDEGVRVNRITALADDIKLALAASEIRIEAPIPGKAAVGIEVPNSQNSTVFFREMIESSEFKNAKSKLSFSVGRDIGGNVIIGNINKMPHLLIAGATGSGKSVCLNTLILSILYKATPDEVKFIMVDPKMVELKPFNDIPHMMVPVVTDAKKAAGALNWAVAEMTDRYMKLNEMNVRDIEGYNAKVESIIRNWDNEEHEEDEVPPVKMPQIVIIVDELADLMMTSPREVEDSICRLAQLARAAGLHLVLATQRPSVNVITGLIKANVPSRISFAVSSSIDSRIIIDMTGAEKLLGKGDMLYFPQGIPKPIRVQGAFASDEERDAVIEYWKTQTDESNSASRKAVEASMAKACASMGSAGAGTSADNNNGRDELFEDCGRYIIEVQKASIGNLQRKFQIGFNRAARIMDQLSEAGVVGPEVGTKAREILMTMEKFDAFISSGE